MASPMPKILCLGFFVLLLAIVEATPPGIAKDPKRVTCNNPKFKECNNLVHVCPKFCPDTCTVDCRSCKPICGADSSSSSSSSSGAAASSTSSPPASSSSSNSSADAAASSKTPPSSSPSSSSSSSSSSAAAAASSTPPTPSSTSSSSSSSAAAAAAAASAPHSSPSSSSSSSSSSAAAASSSNPPPSPSSSTSSSSSSSAAAGASSTPSPSSSSSSSSSSSAASASSSTPPPTPSSSSSSSSRSGASSSSSPKSPPSASSSSSSPGTPPSSSSSSSPSSSSNSSHSPSSSNSSSSSSPGTPPSSSSASSPTSSSSSSSSSSPTPSTHTTPTPSSPHPHPVPPTPKPKKVKCKKKNYSCYGQEHVCPSNCPHTCEVDCVTCKPVCRCDYPGAVCQDPRFIGGDGITFYFHGVKDKSFCLLTDANLHINGHFIGKRSSTMKRDFTWVQSTGILFDNHRLFVGAEKTAKWDDSVDRLALVFDNEPIFLQQTEGAIWQSTTTPRVTITRTQSDTNSIVVEVEGRFKINVKVVPITKKDSDVHGYGITSDDCFAHLDLGFKFHSLSRDVEGVLGKTYRSDYVSKVNVGAKMAVLGGESDYETKGLFTTDCKANRFVENSRENDNDLLDLGIKGLRKFLS